MPKKIVEVSLLALVFYGPTASATDAGADWLAKERAAAERGDASAETSLGLQYALGRHGVAKDAAEAVKWWHKAAEQDYGDAEVLLGDACHQSSKNVVFWTRAGGE